MGVVSLNSVAIPCGLESVSPLYGKNADYVSNSKDVSSQACSSSSDNHDRNAHTSRMRNTCDQDADHVGSDQTISSLAVVEELMARVVLPALHLSPQMLLKGVMLLGPPGVGKTFAVKALKSACAEICTVSYSRSTDR